MLLAGGGFAACDGHAGVRIGRMAHLVDMGDSDSRAAYVALYNTAIGLVLLEFAGLGALVDNRPHFGGLLSCAAMALLGALATPRLAEVQR
jgi:hypothetical protein